MDKKKARGIAIVGIMGAMLVGLYTIATMVFMLGIGKFYSLPPSQDIAAIQGYLPYIIIAVGVLCIIIGVFVIKDPKKVSPAKECDNT